MIAPASRAARSATSRGSITIHFSNGSQCIKAATGPFLPFEKSFEPAKVSAHRHAEQRPLVTYPIEGNGPALSGQKARRGRWRNALWGLAAHAPPSLLSCPRPITTIALPDPNTLFGRQVDLVAGLNIEGIIERINVRHDADHTILARRM